MQWHPTVDPPPGTAFPFCSINTPLPYLCITIPPESAGFSLLGKSSQESQPAAEAAQCQNHGASQSPRDSQRMHPRVRGPGSVNSWMQGPRCTHLCTAGAQQTSFNGRLNQRPVAFPPNRHEGSTSCDLRRLGTCSPPPTPAQLKLPVGLLRAVSTHLAGKKFTWTFGQSSLFWKLCEITDPVFRILCVLIFSPIFRKTGCDVFQSFLVSDKDSRLECLVLNQ